MARNTAETVFTGDAAGLLNAYQQIREANRRQEEQVRELKKAAREAHMQEQRDLREQATLQRQVAAALKSIETPLEQLKQKRAEYRNMLQQGLITEEQYRRLLAQSSAEFQKARENTDKHRQAVRELEAAERRRNEELKEGLRLTREVQTPLEKYREKVRQLDQALANGTITTETHNRQIRRAKDELEKAEGASSKADSAVRKLVSAFMGFVGIHQAIAMVRAEMEHLRKLADDTRLANLDFAGVMKGTRNAFAADDTLNDEQLEGRLIAAAQQARTSPKIFAAAMQDVFSAKGEATNEEAVQAAIAAFRLNPGDLESGRTIAARALDVRQATGSTDFLANIGFLQNLQQNARVTDLASVGKNLVPAISGIMTRGDSAEQAGELVTTLNTLMQDAKGEMTRTAAVALSGQLRDFVPEDKAAAARYATAGSTTERLALMQRSPELAQEFLSDASFEQAAKPFIEKMVTGAADALAVQADKQAKIRPLDAAQAADLERQIAAKEASDRAKLLAQQETADVEKEISQLANLPRAREGQARDIFEQSLQQTNILGEPDLPFNVTARAGFEGRVLLGQDPAAAAAHMLRDRESRFNFEEPDRVYLQRQIDLLERMANGIEQLPGKGPPPEAAQSR